MPFALKEFRRCRGCGERVVVWLLNGASCPRDPYFTCAWCRGGDGSAERAEAAVERSRSRPQLSLVEGVDG